MENIVNPASKPTPAMLDATTLLATPSNSIKVEGKKTGVVTKVPVVVGKTLVQIYIEGLVNLEEAALEITNVEHDLHLAGCQFMQAENMKNGKLIMSGYIRENMEYRTAEKIECGSVNIINKRTSMTIPFKCFTKIQLDSEPVRPNNTGPAKPGETGIAGGTDTNRFHYLNSDEELRFEVAETRIHQVNIKRNMEDVPFDNFGERAFSSFYVNMAVEVTLLVLQNQYVQIPSNEHSGSNAQNKGGKGGKDNSGKGGKSDKGGKNCDGGKNDKNGKGSGDGKNKENQKNDAKKTKFSSLIKFWIPWLK